MGMTNDTKSVLLRLDPEVLERLDERAKQRGKDRTAYIRFAIDQTLKAEDRKEAGWKIATPDGSVLTPSDAERWAGASLDA